MLVAVMRFTVIIELAALIQLSFSNAQRYGVRLTYTLRCYFLYCTACNLLYYLQLESVLKDHSSAKETKRIPNKRIQFTLASRTRLTQNFCRNFLSPQIILQKRAYLHRLS